MMVSFKFLNNPIEFKDGVIPILALENKKLFRNVLCSFENNSEEDFFTFSKNFEPFEFSKHGVFISNPLNVNLESKKLVSKIHSHLENTANTEYEVELAKIKQDLLSLADALCRFCDFDCEYSFDIPTSDIVKILQFKIGKAESSSEELLVAYIKLISKYLKTEVFIVPNLHSFFDGNELEAIYQTLMINHIKLLSLESFVPDSRHGCEKFYIVDKDLCAIDKDGL